MAEYLVLSGESARDRSRLEAMQRAAGLQADAVTEFWHGWITHPITGQEALVVNGEADKEYFTQAEHDALLSQEEAEVADWFIDFEETT